MGWNTSALFARGEDVLALLPVPVTPTGATATADEATSGLAEEVVYVSRAEEWQQLWDPSVIHLADADTGQNSLSVFFFGVSSSYGFILVEDGEVVRRLIYVDGEPSIDEGEPLPIEAEIPHPSWGPDEDWVWAIIKDVTGITYDEDRIFEVYACQD
ncbi:hypothetical protein Rhe02_67730 [Rhizocola hellebori]|uniref:Uncharacterized protein n=1 Tax=Rhizocola hellebori TaxID=1392758 RepID=A0A8J3QG72_9ACTN|nr:hypothetical protein [Rhizocola hellebori]GIH08706.1 hypothetical protein Rhe02_67730 [Rhizocola hellebori]